MKTCGRLIALLIYKHGIGEGDFSIFIGYFWLGRLLSVSTGPSRSAVTRGYTRPRVLIDPYQRRETCFLRGVFFPFLVIFGPAIGRTIIQLTTAGCTGNTNNYNSLQCGVRRLREPIWSVPRVTDDFSPRIRRVLPGPLCTHRARGGKRRPTTAEKRHHSSDPDKLDLIRHRRRRRFCLRQHVCGGVKSLVFRPPTVRLQVPQA